MPKVWLMPKQNELNLKNIFNTWYNTFDLNLIKSKTILGNVLKFGLIAWLRYL